MLVDSEEVARAVKMVAADVDVYYGAFHAR
jgi:hypothetical protein